MRVGDVVTAGVRDLGVHGEGIGSVDGFTVFIPGALFGETVTAKITLVKRAYAVGKLLDILETSPDRVAPTCPVYETCGGCQLSHLSYAAQLSAKRRRVADVLARIGGYPSALVRPVLPAKNPFGYRNKMAVPVGGEIGAPRLGYYRQGSHDIVPVSSCALLQDAHNRLLAFARDFMTRHHIAPYDEKTGKGNIRHILGRTGEGGRLMAVIVTATEDLPCEAEWIAEIRKALPECVSIYHNVRPGRGNVILGKKIRLLWGDETLTAALCGLRFSVSPFSFFQVNPAQAEILYDTALSYAQLTGKETVIDAYCGTGTITLALARNAARAIGIEIVAPAISDAKKNAKRNGIQNAEFLVGDAARLMPKLLEEGTRPDVIVMDPVRAGCDEKVLEAAAQMSPARIVYVSCNPATFARDAARLRERGYELKEVTPVDMFPQTMHVETVALLSKLHEAKHHVNVTVDMDELDVTSAESKATYEEIKQYVAEHNDGMKVSSLYVAQVKQKHGIIERENYNKPKSENVKQPQCPKEKEEAIVEALKHFGMIQ